MSMKRYLIYHLRWQVSAWVMLPIMLFLEKHLPLWLNLMVGQAFGACIFWFVDKWIFTGNNHEKDRKSRSSPAHGESPKMAL